MAKVSFKQYSNFVDASDEELDEGFGEFVSKVFGNSAHKPDDKRLEKLKADRQKLLNRKTTVQATRDKAQSNISGSIAKQVAANGQKVLDRDAAKPSNRSLAAQGRAAELDWVKSMSEAFGINESVMSNIHMELSELMPMLKSGKIEMYDVMNKNMPSVSKSTKKYLQHMYDMTAAENNLHADDDFEKIEKIMMKELSKQLK